MDVLADVIRLLQQQPGLLQSELTAGLKVLRPERVIVPNSATVRYVREVATKLGLRVQVTIVRTRTELLSYLSSTKPKSTYVPATTVTTILLNELAEVQSVINLVKQERS